MNVFFSIFGKEDQFPSTPSSSLTQSLKEETIGIHAQLEKHEFVKRLLGDTLEASSYQQSLVDLRVVYEVLEAGIRLNLNTHPQLRKIYFPELERFTAIKEDLSSLSFKSLPVHVSNIANDYATYLNQLAQNEPLLLIAHAYARYLGDMSGGMILKGHVNKKWPDAIQLYDFTAVLKKTQKTNLANFKEFYKECLDNLALSQKEILEILKEAKVAFEYSEKMFDAIPL